jgi:hypothetical protein
MMTTAWVSIGASEVRKACSVWIRSWRLVFVGPGPVLRDNAEVLEQLLQKVVAFEQRVVNDREERLPLEPLHNGPAEEGLAGADLAGDDDQRFAPLERVGDLRERGCV